MLSDNEMIQLMINEPSWEDVIVKIVAEENMDPWSIDIVKLADSFTKYIEKMQENDLRVPARFILVSAILLRMKSDIFAEKKKTVIPESSEQNQKEEEIRTLASIPPIQPPVKRLPVKNVSMNELITALKKAFEVQERRKIRKHRLKKAVYGMIPENEEDISKRIDKLLSHIKSIIKDIEDKVEFSKIVKEWKRENIVDKLIPMLHLANENKLEYEQQELFNEIFIKIKQNAIEQQSG